jgi:hypothetical protein
VSGGVEKSASVIVSAFVFAFLVVIPEGDLLPSLFSIPLHPPGKRHFSRSRSRGCERRSEKSAFLSKTPLRQNAFVIAYSCCHPERSEASRRTKQAKTIRTFPAILFCAFAVICSLLPTPSNRHFDRSRSRRVAGAPYIAVSSRCVGIRAEREPFSLFQQFLSLPSMHSPEYPFTSLNNPPTTCVALPPSNADDLLRMLSF